MMGHVFLFLLFNSISVLGKMSNILLMLLLLAAVTFGRQARTEKYTKFYSVDQVDSYLRQYVRSLVECAVICFSEDKPRCLGYSYNVENSMCNLYATLPHDGLTMTPLLGGTEGRVICKFADYGNMYNMVVFIVYSCCGRKNSPKFTYK